MTPTPLTPAELHTAAVSVLERVELLSELVVGGKDPELRGITGALDAALALHRSIAYAMDGVDLDPDGDDVLELQHTLGRVGDTLAVVIRTIDLVSMTRAAAEPAVASPAPAASPMPVRPGLGRREASAADGPADGTRG